MKVSGAQGQVRDGLNVGNRYRNPEMSTIFCAYVHEPELARSFKGQHAIRGNTTRNSPEENGTPERVSERVFEGYLAENRSKNL